MYAQLIEGGTTPDRRAEMDRIVTDELIPALEAEPGYAGAMNPVNPASGDGMMLVLWQTVEQAHHPLSDYGAAFLKALAQLAAISTGDAPPDLRLDPSGLDGHVLNASDRLRPLLADGADRR